MTHLNFNFLVEGAAQPRTTHSLTMNCNGRTPQVKLGPKASAAIADKRSSKVEGVSAKVRCFSPSGGGKHVHGGLFWKMCPPYLARERRPSEHL